MTELREFGDGKTVVLWTDNREIANKVGKRKNCYKIISYEQDLRNKVALVGIDFYFPKRETKALLKFCE